MISKHSITTLELHRQYWKYLRDILNCLNIGFIRIPEYLKKISPRRQEKGWYRKQLKIKQTRKMKENGHTHTLSCGKCKRMTYLEYQLVHSTFDL